MPKIYGNIKSRVNLNKINFYQNIKRNHKINITKNFKSQDVVQEYVKPKTSKSKYEPKIVEKSEKKSVRVEIN